MAKANGKTKGGQYEDEKFLLHLDKLREKSELFYEYLKSGVLSDESNEKKIDENRVTFVTSIEEGIDSLNAIMNDLYFVSMKYVGEVRAAAENISELAYKIGEDELGISAAQIEEEIMAVITRRAGEKQDPGKCRAENRKESGWQRMKGWTQSKPRTHMYFGTTKDEDKKHWYKNVKDTGIRFYFEKHLGGNSWQDYSLDEVLPMIGADGMSMGIDQDELVAAVTQIVEGYESVLEYRMKTENEHDERDGHLDGCAECREEMKDLTTYEMDDAAHANEMAVVLRDLANRLQKVAEKSSEYAISKYSKYSADTKKASEIER